MGRTKCRLWWPEHLLSCNPDSDLLLFGWYVQSLNSLDIVVAIATSPSEVSRRLHQSDLQEKLHSADGKMPMPLQESTKFSLLGHCAADCSNHDLKMVGNQYNDPPSESTSEQLQGLGLESKTTSKDISCDSVNQLRNQKSSAEATFAGNCISCNCGCMELDQFIEPHRQSLIRYSGWIQLLCKSQRILCKGTGWVPELHHMHQNGRILPICDVHLIIYELPTYGRHHFALSSSSYPKKVRTTYRKPKWVDELHRKPMPPDLDTVVLALNCASAAIMYYERSLGTENPVIHFRRRSMLASMVWHTVAVFVASISTALFIILQFFHSLLSYGSQMSFFMVLPMIFRHTWSNVHIRSCQIMYWPIFLEGSGVSFQSNVGYAHIAALRKHFIWSSVVTDVLLGFILGVALLANLDDVCSWVLFVVRNITDNLLRSGCVWLMGVPAGFKLNTELAELLGMISLNAIQVCSTLWFFMGPFLWCSIKGIAFSGILLGLTIPAALCIDMLKLSTMHVLALHWLISFLYSLQIQALASLWRLFRGRKWNPLRQRLDSYDCSVEQHVVGSLLFTPLLLLLPTTSVFYIFFTILNSTINFICITIEITISILHATPYAEILLWIMRRKRFPSGIWLEIISCPAVSTPASHGSSDEGYSPSTLDRRKTGCFVYGGPETVVSLLHSNYATIGQIIAPHFRYVFHGVSPSFGASWAYGVLSGQRIPSTLQTSLPPTTPWMHLGFRDYWRLCHSSVLACRS